MLLQQKKLHTAHTYTHTAEKRGEEMKQHKHQQKTRQTQARSMTRKFLRIKEGKYTKKSISTFHS
jgi:hypothetical protein